MTIGHFRITFSLFLKASLGAHLSYENEISFTLFDLHVNEISFSYERMSTKTRFAKEAILIFIWSCKLANFCVINTFAEKLAC